MTGSKVPLLIETHGKQAYIFETGKRREGVGASYLVHAVTDWAREALPPTAEILVATSGTVLAFVEDRRDAVAVVRHVTGRALQDAPGLGVTGVVGHPVPWESGGAPAAVAGLFRTMTDVRARRPGPAARFPVLPVTALCPSSALPVAGLAGQGEELVARSAPSLAKLRAFETALTRLAGLSDLSVAHLRAGTERLAGDHEDSPERVAVVHADGNGLGRLVARLSELLVPEGAADPDTRYVRGYRQFSEALAGVAEQAFRGAVAEVSRDGSAPDVLPLVIGGDDITFVADAAVAPRLTRAFLSELVRIAAATDAVAGPVAADSPAGDPRLGIAAGMVIVTPHFPFSTAYQLAEELLTEVAKQAKTTVTDVGGRPVPCVSLAIHVQLDTTAVGSAQRRATLTSDGRLLTAAPYVEFVSGGADRVLSATAQDWLRGRRLDTDLVDLAGAIVAVDAEGRRLRPSAQLHRLRHRLRPDPAVADEYLRRLVEADPHRWRLLVEDDGSLFTARDGARPTTRFLDALALAPFGTEPADG